MSKRFQLSKIIVDTFLEESGINERIELGDEKAVIQKRLVLTRYANWTIPAQAEDCNLSVDTINNYIRELKDLYDLTQKYSKVLPPRDKSKWSDKIEGDDNDKAVE